MARQDEIDEGVGHRHPDAAEVGRMQKILQVRAMQRSASAEITRWFTRHLLTPAIASSYSACRIEMVAKEHQLSPARVVKTNTKSAAVRSGRAFVTCSQVGTRQIARQGGSLYSNLTGNDRLHGPITRISTRAGRYNSAAKITTKRIFTIVIPGKIIA
jgi:hypothetical protein